MTKYFKNRNSALEGLRNCGKKRMCLSAAFLCLRIDRWKGGGYKFWSVCLQKNYKIGHNFFKVSDRASYFTWAFLVGRPFVWCQGKGHLSRSGSNIKVTFFKKRPLGVINCFTNSFFFFSRFFLLFFKWPFPWSS